MGGSGTACPRAALAAPETPQIRRHPDSRPWVGPATKRRQPPGCLPFSLLAALHRRMDLSPFSFPLVGFLLVPTGVRGRDGRR